MTPIYSYIKIHSIILLNLFYSSITSICKCTPPSSGYITSLDYFFVPSALIKANNDEIHVILDDKADKYACTQILYIIQKNDDTNAAILTFFTLLGHINTVYDTACHNRKYRYTILICYNSYYSIYQK